MNARDAYAILDTLMDGIHPVTGEILPEGHVCHEPAVLRALHLALQALDRADDAPAAIPLPLNRKNGRPNAGRPWTQEDLDLLRQLHGAGANLDEMCHRLQRRKRGVARELAYLGLTESDENAVAPRKAQPRSGAPWTADEDKLLWDLWKQNASIAAIADELQRTSYAIERRMARLGMLDPEDADAAPLLPPWSLSDVQLLKRLHTSGSTPDEIAAQMKRPVESIRARLFYMGLIREAPVSLR